MFTSTTSACLLSAFIGLASATIDNTKASAALTARATLLVEGDYILTNVANNQSITYVESGQNWFPSSSGDGSATTFDQSSVGPYMRLSTNQGAQKCVSAQWGYDEAGDGIGADHAGVLYVCAVGPGADSGSTVEKTKQWWLMVPVSNSSTSSNLVSDTLLADDSSDNSTSATCNKTRGWIQRHPLYVKGPKFHHTECASYLRASQAASMNVTVDASTSGHKKRNLAKRASDSAVNGGTFYIIALDHLLDMPTRALSGSAASMPDSNGSKGTNMEVFAEGTELQQWVVTAAN